MGKTDTNRKRERDIEGERERGKTDTNRKRER